jgi:TonB family protein
MGTKFFRIVLFVASLIAGIGLAAAQESPTITPPRPIQNPGYWVRQQDYPSRALREDKEGRVRFQLTVSAEGTVTGCNIVESSGSIDLDEATCSQLRLRATFLPARDEGGKAVAATWSASVRWVLPFPYPVRRGDIYLGILPAMKDKGGNGIRVAAVLRGPAREAGIRAGDIIKRINGREVQDAPGAILALLSVREGSEYPIEIERDMQNTQFRVDARAFPSDTAPEQKALKTEMWDKAGESKEFRDFSMPYL